MAAPDPFATLNRVVSKYRRDVHRLMSPASADAVASVETHLGRRIPPGLRSFFQQYNGAELFRGALRVRSVNQIATASEEESGVFLFADSHDGTRWAYGRNPDGGHAFGFWEDDRLVPLHHHFFTWLNATVEILDARVDRPEDQRTIRFATSPDDPHQLYRAGLRALHAGRPEEAHPLFERCLHFSPDHSRAWQHLGDTLVATDRTAARKAWLRSLHLTRLPLPWPGAPCPDPEILPSLSRTFSDPEAWEAELEHFLEERVHDVRTPEAFRLMVAAATSLADSYVNRGRRELARKVLDGLLARCSLFHYDQTPWTAARALIRLEIDLGMHDSAEQRIRTLRKSGPDDEQAGALLLLGHLTVMRGEPWAEEILTDAMSCARDDDQRIDAALLHVERCLRHNQIDEGRRWFERAKILVDQGAPRMLQARTAISAGDLAKASLKLQAAEEAYADARRILADRPAPELRFRLMVRQGDLALHHQEPELAHRFYTDAAAGYAAHELPLRSAWVLLRLAQLDPNASHLIEAARERFFTADLAAGVAVADSMSQAPGASLEWHLERATEHARARYNAQRGRPPWGRADAERPERRLGAHRMAIAASPDAIVQALESHMVTAAKAIRGGRARPLDPPVLRYTAAVDLLSGHRSYAAAQVLLAHLLNDTVDGTARRALLGVVARSPNAALVDGLLQCIENPSRTNPSALTAAAEALGRRKETEAFQALLSLSQPPNGPLARRAAITALGRLGIRSAVDHIVHALDEPTLAEATALSLLMLGDRRGIDFHARALSDGRRDLSGHPGEIVGRYGGPSHLLVLIPAATSREDDAALGALHGLGLMGDPRAVPSLLKALDPRNPRRAEVASGALQILTGHAQDLEEPQLQRRWYSWWEANEERFQVGIRYREGAPYTSALLIDRMSSNVDAWSRRTAYDELVITTGQPLPFDSDGPWRNQRAHLRAWKEWWAAHQHHLPAGRWYLDGAPID